MRAASAGGAADGKGVGDELDREGPGNRGADCISGGNRERVVADGRGFAGEDARGVSENHSRRQGATGLHRKTIRRLAATHQEAHRAIGAHKLHWEVRRRDPLHRLGHGKREVACGRGISAGGEAQRDRVIPETRRGIDGRGIGRSRDHARGGVQSQACRQSRVRAPRVGRFSLEDLEGV